MSNIGIVADLVYGTEENRITVAEGYVEINFIKGGPNYQPDGYPAVPGGQWLAFISWYASLASRQEDVNSSITLPAIPGVNPRDYMQLAIPYVAGEDPYQSVMAVLQQWFPSGTVVDPFAE